MTEVVQIVSRLEQAGGKLALDGDCIRYTIPSGSSEARALLAELRKHREGVKGLLRLREVTENHYQTCLRAVLEQTMEPDYPMGLVPWLESVEPNLYRDITSRLPNLIHDLWASHAPLPEFERVTAEWLLAHRRACALFRSRDG